MAKPILTYKGYTGTAELSLEDNCVHGKVLFVNDLVTYEAERPDLLQNAFEQAVDHYLESCAEQGVTPDKPCSGTFNVRISAELHRAACLRAAIDGTSLNDFVKDAIQRVVSGAEVVHHHTHTHLHSVYTMEESFQERSPTQWQMLEKQNHH